MAVYEITAPDGLVYEVEGEGTEAEALAEFEQQWNASGGKIEGGVAAAEPQGSLMDRMLGSMAETGKNVRESVMNPGQSIPDLLRSSSDFVSFGLTDRLRSALKGTDLEEERAKTRAADTRLGSIDDAFNLGTAFLQPSAAARSTGGVVKNALAYGAEGAGLAGLDALGHGEDPGKAMLAGGAGGAGGSLAADTIGGASRMFDQTTPPQFDSAEALEAAAKKKKSGKGFQSHYGPDVVVRDDLVSQLNTAATKGKKGVQDLSAAIEGYGRDPAIPRKVYDEISRLGHAPNKGSVLRRGAANLMDFGGGFMGKILAAKVSGGALPIASTVLKTVDDLSSEINPKQLAKVKTMLLQGAGGKTNPAMTPEMKNELRHYLAKMTTTGARDRQR